MKKGLALLTTLGLAITGCTTNVFAADVVIKLADVQAENDVETQFEYKFAELVNEKSDGRIEVQVYPAGQMGEMTDILTAVQSGSMQMTRTNPSWLADAGVSSMNLLALPFVFDDLDSANKVLDSDVGQKILNQVEESDTMVKALGYLEPSGRYFFFKNKKYIFISNQNVCKIFLVFIFTILNYFNFSLFSFYRLFYLKHLLNYN